MAQYKEVSGGNAGMASTSAGGMRNTGGKGQESEFSQRGRPYGGAMNNQQRFDEGSNFGANMSHMSTSNFHQSPIDQHVGGGYR